MKRIPSPALVIACAAFGFLVFTLRSDRQAAQANPAPSQANLARAESGVSDQPVLGPFREDYEKFAEQAKANAAEHWNTVYRAKEDDSPSFKSRTHRQRGEYWLNRWHPTHSKLSYRQTFDQLRHTYVALSRLPYSKHPEKIDKMYDIQDEKARLVMVLTWRLTASRSIKHFYLDSNVWWATNWENGRRIGFHAVPDNTPLLYVEDEPPSKRHP